MGINYNKKLTTANIIVYPKTGQIKVGSEIKRISLVNMNVMMLLIRNQGQVVSRNQLFENVWRNQVVTDETLTRCISDIRLQVGKDFIKTLPKRGYQWVPKVKQDSKKQITKKPTLLYWATIVLLGIILLSFVSLWIANKVISSN